jgi:hypothetical protein
MQGAAEGFGIGVPCIPWDRDHDQLHRYATLPGPHPRGRGRAHPSAKAAG